MKEASPPKAAQSTAATHKNIGSGPAGIAATPPGYGIDFLDADSRRKEHNPIIHVPAIIDVGRGKRTNKGNAASLMRNHLQQGKGASVLQKKPRIGASNDPLEQEADRVADQVLSGSTVSDISHSVPGTNRKTAQSYEGSEEVPASVDQVLASSGKPLDSNIRQDMEQRFSQDFSNVRVHTGGAAEQSALDMNANAYTVGNNIVFGPGQFAPGYHGGLRLLAHELTHVMQQANGATMLQRQVVLSQVNPPLPVEEIRTRYRLLDATLTRLDEKYKAITGAPDKILAAQNRSSWDQALIAAASGALLPDDARAYSNAIRGAAEILERTERVIPALVLQRQTLSTASAPADSQAGYAAAFDKVITAYLDAIARCLDSDADKAFNDAEAAAEALPAALIEVDLTHVESHSPSYDLIEERRKEMVAWSQWVRGELKNLGPLVQAVKTARETRASDLPQREAALAEEREFVELSLEGLGHWEKGLLAYEYLADEGNLIMTAYRSVGRILRRCAGMRDAAFARDLKLLRDRVGAHASDPNVDQFYRGLPVIAFGSRFLVQLGVTIIAAYVTAGLGTLVMGGGAGASTAAGGTSLLATAGSVAVEAISFTLISRGLLAALPGKQGANDSILADLLWNLGLFTVLRGISVGVKGALAAKGLPALTGIATAVTSFPLLQGYGLLRYRLAKGEWPSDAERAQMTAENIVMLGALTAGMSAMQGLLSAKGKLTELGKFYKKYGWRFETLDVGRRVLENRLADLGKSTTKVSPSDVQDVNDKAKIIEDEFKKILDEVKADTSIDLGKIRDELTKAGKDAPEGASELLERELGILGSGERVRLRGAGGTRFFSYEWGKTGVLEAALRKLGAIVKKSADPTTGLRTLTAELVAGEPPMVFQERTEIMPEHPVDLSDPVVQKLLADFAIADSKAIRLVQLLLERELAKNPMPDADAAKRMAGPVRVVRRYLTELKAGSKEPVEKSLTDLGPTAREATAKNKALVAAAKTLVAGGLLEDAGWLSARTDEEFLGILGERLATREVFAAAAKRAGTRVITGVHFIGDAFVDAARTQPAMRSGGGPFVNTDVTSELDYLVVIEPTPGNFEYTSVQNAKVTKDTAKSLVAAKEQNANAIEALDAHKAGRAAAIKEGATIARYATVTKIVGTDAQTGAVVDLTGKVRAGKAVSEETIGAKGDKGYSKELPYSYGEIKQMVKVLRELQLMKAIGE